MPALRPQVDFQNALRDMAASLVRLKHPDRFLKMLTKYLHKEFGLAHASLLIYEETRDRFVVFDSRGTKRLPSSLIKMEMTHSLPSWFASPKHAKTYKDDYLYRASVKQHVKAEREPGLMLEILKTMESLKVDLVVPGYFKKKLQGLLLLGPKNHGRAFSNAEISFFQILVQDAAIAVKSAEYSRNLAERNRELKERLDEIEKLRKKERDTYHEIMCSLAQEVHAKDPYTFGHIGQVERLGLMVAKEMGMEISGRDGDILSAGLILHDVGKIGIPDAILKKTSSLNDEEWKIMRTHPQKGMQILSHLTDFKRVAEIVYSHHENFDGSGYPRGLKGHAIPVESRIVSVVDAFHAIVSTRPYSKGRSVEVALDELKRCAGSQFDPEVVEAFTRALKREMKKRGVGFFIGEGENSSSAAA